MNKKSFFWPILSEEEREGLAKGEPEEGETQTTANRKFPFSGPIIPTDAPVQTPVPEERNSPWPQENSVFEPEPVSSIPPVRPVAVMPSASMGGKDEHPVDMPRAGEASVGQLFHSEHEQEKLREPLLVLENIHRSYAQADKDLVVLEGANLTVRAGEMVALVAPSGAGKSTLLHVAGLLERPSSGEVIIAGKPQSLAADRVRTLVRRHEIGFVYQFHHLLAEFTALENVTLPQLIRGENASEAKVRALELLSYLKVDHRADHRPAELSGGEQQRVAIARAMANAPRVLMADEPTGNLDPNTSEYVFKALNSLVKQSGIAALVATHNLFLAERMDRQITLVDGKVVEL